MGRRGTGVQREAERRDGGGDGGPLSPHSQERAALGPVCPCVPQSQGLLVPLPKGSRRGRVASLSTFCATAALVVLTISRA